MSFFLKKARFFKCIKEVVIAALFLINKENNSKN